MSLFVLSNLINDRNFFVVFVGKVPDGYNCPLNNSSNYTDVSFNTTYVTSSVGMEWYLICESASLHAHIGTVL